MPGGSIEKVENDILYKKINDIINNKRISDKNKLNLILKEYQINCEIFHRLFGVSHNSELVEEKCKNIHQILASAIKYNLFFTIRFFLDFFDFSNVQKPQILNFLRDQELSGKNVESLSSDQLQSKIINLIPYRGFTNNNCQPLIFVAARYDCEGHITKLLLRKGANLNLVSNKNPDFISNRRDYWSFGLDSIFTPEPIQGTALGEAISAKNKVTFDILINHHDIDLHKSLQYLYYENSVSSGKFANLLLDRVYNITKIGSDGLTLLHRIICEHGMGSIFDVLIERDENNINIKTREGNTLLHHAIISSNPQRDLENLVKHLLRSGIDVNAQNNEGNTALHLLAQMTSLNIGTYQEQILEDTIQYLLLYQDERRTKNNLGQTALDLASERYKEIFRVFYLFCDLKSIVIDENKSEAIKIQLIKKQYTKNPMRFHDIFLMKRQNYDPEASYLVKILFSSISYNLFEVTKFLLYLPEILFDKEELDVEPLNNFRSQINISSQVNMGFRTDLDLLEAAVESDNTGKIINLLINYRYDAEESLDRMKILKLAILRNNQKSVLEIIDHQSFDPKYHVLGFLTQRSVTLGELKIFKKLLTRINDLEQKNEFGETFLHEAIRICRNDSLMQMLLTTKNMDLHAKTFKDGLTPLHIALSKSGVGNVKTLLELGASADCRDNNNLTPFDAMIGSLVRSKSLHVDDPTSNSQNFISQELDKIFFKDKVKLLLKFCGQITFNKALQCHDQSKKIDRKNIFWINLQLIISSIINEASRETVMEVSKNNIRCEVRYTNTENFKQKNPKRQKL